MKALVDENLSPTLVGKLAGIGVAAVHVAHTGRRGASDPELWRLALAEDRVVITINARDFLMLARQSELHAGLIVLRAQGLSREEQWGWVEPVFTAFTARDGDLVNRVIEVVGAGSFTCRALPPD